MNKKLKTIQDLIPDDKNANAGTERGTALLAESLQKLGAGRSIVVDKNGVVIGGNKTLEQAAAIGMDVTIVPSDGSRLIVVQRTDLDINEPNGRGLAYLDNRAGELGLDWDAAQIAADAAAGRLPPAGWADWELAALTNRASADLRQELTRDHEAVAIAGEDTRDQATGWAESYVGGQVRQMILIMDPEQFNALVDGFDEIRADNPDAALESNYQVVAWLLDFYRTTELVEQ